MYHPSPYLHAIVGFFKRAIACIRLPADYSRLPSSHAATLAYPRLDKPQVSTPRAARTVLCRAALCVRLCLCVFVCVLSRRCLVCRPSHWCVCRVGIPPARIQYPRGYYAEHTHTTLRCNKTLRHRRPFSSGLRHGSTTATGSSGCFASTSAGAQLITSASASRPGNRLRIFPVALSGTCYALSRPPPLNWLVAKQTRSSRRF